VSLGTDKAGEVQIGKSLSGPAKHLGKVSEETDGLPVSAAVDHGADQRANIVFGNITDRCFAECG
jgi:allophanate hydrolase subunit 2